MRRRRLVLVVGVVAFALAVVELAVPGLIGIPQDHQTVATFLVGAALLGYGVVSVVDVHREPPALRPELTLEQASPADPETAIRVPAPGDDERDTLDQFADRRVRPGTGVADSVRGAAVEALVAFADVSRSEAAAAVRDGRWPDDPYAVGFLGGEPAAGLPAFVRLQQVLFPRATHERGRDRAVAAVAELAGERSGSHSPARPSYWPEWLPSLDVSRLPVPPRRGPSAEPTPEPPVSGRSPEPNGDADPTGAPARATNHWFGVSTVATVSLGVGLFVERPAVLLAGVAGVVFAAYARSGSVEELDVAVERTLAVENPAPGEDVEVTVSVTNEGERTLSDLRVVDGVPDALAVADGSPRTGAVLRSGETASFTYALAARRGRHEFDPVLVIARDAASSVELVDSDVVESTIECVPPLRPVRTDLPLREQANWSTGPVETARSGDGVEFHSTRAYRRGDPKRRIDWNRLARTGERSTLEFREERLATAVVVVDVQRSAYLAPGPDSDHAVDRSVAAATRLFATLAEDGHQVGLATMGGPACWLAPSSGTEHRDRARTLLAFAEELSSRPPETTADPERWQDVLRRRVSTGAQAVVVSPLCDRFTVHAIRRLDALGRAVTVVSPDPTAGRTWCQRLARVGRELNVTELRSAGVPVVDWPRDVELDVALARATWR